MNISTKFNFKDLVWRIDKTQTRTWKKCGFCVGSGRIIGHDGNNAICPVCRGQRGNYFFSKESWLVMHMQLTIGEIKVTTRCEYKAEDETIFDNYSDQEALYTEQYMCYETGIGSGTLWPVEHLFKFKEDAQVACDYRNKEEANDKM